MVISALEAHMNKTYAIEIIEMVDRGMLESTSRLYKEAKRYYERLKNKDQQIISIIDKNIYN